MTWQNITNSRWLFPVVCMENLISDTTFLHRQERSLSNLPSLPFITGDSLQWRILLQMRWLLSTLERLSARL